MLASNTIIIRELEVGDYDAALALWQASAGVGLGDSDSRQGIEMFLERNPGLSYAAWSGEELVGVVLCGHDGRRGYIHHLAVSSAHRRRSIGRDLVARCMAALKAAGIRKAHLFVFRENAGAISFWREIGWEERTDLILMSKYPQISESN